MRYKERLSMGEGVKYYLQLILAHTDNQNL